MANRPATPEEDLQRFWSKVRVRPDDCWDYLGAKFKSGYGNFGTGGVKNKRTWRAHRYAYERLVGPIPNGAILHHLCNNKWCVNPDHLEVTTQAHHITHMTPGSVSYKNSRKTKCPHGHPYSESNTRYRNRGNGKVHRECLECDRIRARAYSQRRNRRVAKA